jgi:hypothetical protein
MGKQKPEEKQKSRWMRRYTFSLILIVAAMLCIGWFKIGGLLAAWIGVMLLLIASLAIIGLGTTGLCKGVLIDDRNMLSLSRFQMVLWTILILSAFITASLSNLAAGVEDEDSLSIKIPEELWILMGISTTSLVGSPLIKSTKYSKETREDDINTALEHLKRKGLKEEKIEFKGHIIAHKEPEMASFSNLFEGEEAGNAARIDLAKVQMFYFTIILVLSYAVALGKMFAGGAPIHEFPALDPSMIWLLGISHGGYLVHKAVPHTRS